MNADGSSEDDVPLGTLPKDGPNSPPRASKSGINLRDPADSGISLEKGKGKDPKKGDSKNQHDSESDVDFELSLDSSSIPSSTKLGAPKSGKLVIDTDSSSEFELTLDDSGGSSIEKAALGEAAAEAADKGDIFETDFEIPPMPDESASEAVPVDSDTDLDKSDFELEMNEADVATDEPSESEVVLLDDEGEADAEAPAPKSRAKVKTKKKSEAEVDLADEPDEESASKALKGVKGKPDEDEDSVPVGAVVERPTKPWGVIPVLFLAPSLLVVMLGAIMGYEMLSTMWGYQQPRKATAPIIRGIASMFDMEIRDQ
jgi:hypothetical protein